MTWSVETPINKPLKGPGKWNGTDANVPMQRNALYGRKWKILIANADDSAAWDVSNLRCIFEVKKSRETRNYATISIYNLTPETEQAIIMGGDRLIIEAGYGVNEAYVDEVNISGGIKTIQYGVIFDGKILYPSRKRENNTDFVLTLLAGEGNNPLGLGWVSQTLSRGMNQREITKSVCELAETKIETAGISENLSPQRTTRGKVLFGEPKDFLDNLVRGNNATYWVDKDVVTVAKYTDVRPDEALVFTPQTGLIGVPSQTQYGASWTLLLNPNVKMFGLCQLTNSYMNEYQATPGTAFAPIDKDWIYQVCELTHKGDTWGNEWYTICEGVSRTGKSMLLSMMANNNANPRGG